MNLVGMDETREWLRTQGFRFASNYLAHLDNEANWYAYKYSTITARECECNDGKPAQVVVYPHHYRTPMSLDRKSVEIEVCGETGGLWYRLRASVDAEKLPERLDVVEKSLVCAWNALA